MLLLLNLFRWILMVRLNLSPDLWVEWISFGIRYWDFLSLSVKIWSTSAFINFLIIWFKVFCPFPNIKPAIYFVFLSTAYTSRIGLDLFQKNLISLALHDWWKIIFDGRTAFAVLMILLSSVVIEILSILAMLFSPQFFFLMMFSEQQSLPLNVSLTLTHEEWFSII